MEHSFLFIEKDVEDTIDSLDSIRLLDENIAGVLIRNFLTTDETQKILEGLKGFDQEKKIRIDEGFISLPMTFAQYTQMRSAGVMSEQDYVDISTDFREEFERRFGVNVEQKLIRFFESFFKNVKVEALLNNKYNAHTIPFTFRELAPNYGELIVHCENLFFDEFPDFFKWLQENQVAENKFSFFITLQAAEQGGELCCYELNWQSVKNRVSPTLLKSNTGEEKDLLSDSVKRAYIKPKEGDLLLFAGGNIWHRVEKVFGNKSRVTLGGFVAKTNIENTFYMWS